MVRINDKDFDQDAIAEIYGSSGKLVETIRKRIEPIIGMDSLASIVFTKWFFRDRGTDNLTPNERISSFLQSKALKDLIEEYALIACETLWGNGHLYYALLHYKDIVSKAEKTKKHQKATQNLPKTCLTSGCSKSGTIAPALCALAPSSFHSANSLLFPHSSIPSTTAPFRPHHHLRHCPPLQNLQNKVNWS